MESNLEQFAPLFQPDTYSPDDQWHLAPFFTNLEKSVYVPLVVSPELIGALCSRTSRAAGDLRHIFLNEFVYPFVRPVRDAKDTDDTWQEKIQHGEALKDFITFLHQHPLVELFSNPRARSFYNTWLAQYGDDSIAQMAGGHLVYSGISQVTIKHLEDQRVSLAPIEKSTRYVNYGVQTNGSYRYYTDPTLKQMGLAEEYRRAMDTLFETYKRLIPRMIAWLTEQFPQEKPSVIEKKAFDTLRGLLPNAALSQVAFFGNGQAFEYLMARSLRHGLGEIRWAARSALKELHQVVPSFLRRASEEKAKEYHEYLANKKTRMAPLVETILGKNRIQSVNEPRVTLIEYDLDGETKIIAGILYDAPNNHATWEENLGRARAMTHEKRKQIFDTCLAGRTARWQKMRRGFENVYVRFEIVMNIGAWRDLHRHRMHTQERQNFSCYHGFDIPPEIVSAGLENDFASALNPLEDVFQKIVPRDPDLAQYATTLAHRVRFMQWQNLRQAFWETELRTIPEGHPDYRVIEQQKYLELKKVYPLIADYMLVNMGNYDFARRGQEEKIQKKLEKLT